MGSLYVVIEEGNKLARGTTVLWQVYVRGLDEAVGLMPAHLVDKTVWDSDSFFLDTKSKAIVISPRRGGNEDCIAALRRAFMDLAFLNQGNVDLNGVFDRWIAKPAAKRDFHVILNTSTDGKWLGLSIPTPARGLFGVVTAGVHLNVYSTVKPLGGKERISRIWVSQRASGPKYSYPGMLDQIVAGGVDPADQHAGRLAPFLTLQREAQEEAGLYLDIYSRNMMQVRDGQQRVVGTIREAAPITFYDQKGGDAGRGERGHVEPGVRFVYDLKVPDDFSPQKAEASVERFESFRPDEVKAQLRAKKWKPNCGLVMLDFLMRKGLIEDDERLDDIKAALRKPLPFEYMRQGMPSIEPWGRPQLR